MPTIMSCSRRADRASMLGVKGRAASDMLPEPVIGDGVRPYHLPMRAGTVGVVLAALLLAGCSGSSGRSSSFTDGRNYALQHSEGALASVCFGGPRTPAPKGDNLKD